MIINHYAPEQPFDNLSWESYLLISVLSIGDKEFVQQPRDLKNKMHAAKNLMQFWVGLGLGLTISIF